MGFVSSTNIQPVLKLLVRIAATSALTIVSTQSSFKYFPFPLQWKEVWCKMTNLYFSNIYCEFSVNKLTNILFENTNPVKNLRSSLLAHNNNTTVKVPNIFTGRCCRTPMSIRPWRFPRNGRRMRSLRAGGGETLGRSWRTGRTVSAS